MIKARSRGEKALRSRGAVEEHFERLCPFSPLLLCSSAPLLLCSSAPLLLCSSANSTDS
jgi:hypothetical protein